jgi:hypothetical protein
MYCGDGIRVLFYLEAQKIRCEPPIAGGRNRGMKTTVSGVFYARRERDRGPSHSGAWMPECEPDPDA